MQPIVADTGKNLMQRVTAEVIHKHTSLKLEILSHMVDVKNAS
jgi:hypothetical protein